MNRTTRAVPDAKLTVGEDVGNIEGFWVGTVVDGGNVSSTVGTGVGSDVAGVERK